eukprot:4820690-Prymnesium_polylepis.1
MLSRRPTSPAPSDDSLGDSSFTRLAPADAAVAALRFLVAAWSGWDNEPARSSDFDCATASYTPSPRAEELAAALGSAGWSSSASVGADCGAAGGAAARVMSLPASLVRTWNMPLCRLLTTLKPASLSARTSTSTSVRARVLACLAVSSGSAPSAAAVASVAASGPMWRAFASAAASG